MFREAIESPAHGLIFFDDSGALRHFNRKAGIFLPSLRTHIDTVATLGSLVTYLYDHAVECDERLTRSVESFFTRPEAIEGFREIITWEHGRNCLVQVQRMSSGGTVVILSDLSQCETRAEELDRVFRHNQQLLAAVEATVHGIAISNPRESGHPIVFVNEAFCDVLGLPREEIVGSDWAFIMDALSNPVLTQEIERAIGQRVSVDVPFQTRKGSQETRWHNLRFSPIVNGAGQNVFFAGVLTDITAIKMGEAQLLQSQKLEALGYLAGGVAHDFNNILSIIDGYARLIEQIQEATPALLEHTGKIRAAVSRGAGLTRQLLTFGRKHPNMEGYTDLGRLIRDQELLLRPLLDASIALNLQISKGLFQIACLPDLIGQAVINLVVNARDAMPEGGFITVTLAPVAPSAMPRKFTSANKTKAYVALSVTDTGTGMDSTTLKKAFDPFYTTKDQGKGTGLGLSMVYGLIVHQLGGFVDIQTAPERGTCVTLYIPLCAASAAFQDHAAHNAAPFKEGTPYPRFDGLTAIIAEDEPELLALLADHLEKSGMRVLRAQNGNAALALQEKVQGPVDFLITDIVMPELDGLRLAPLFESLRPESRIIFMSGYPAHGTMAKGEIPAHAAFLPKPVAWEDLATLMQRLMQGENMGGHHAS